MSTTYDTLKWTPVLTVHKWQPTRVTQIADRLGHLPDPRELHQRFAPDETLVSRGNLLTNAGLTRLTNLLIGAGGQAADTAHTRIGVGNSSTAEDVTQVDLQASAGASNRFFQMLDAGFPTVATGATTFKATIGVSDGNFIWNEWGIDIGATANGTTVNAPLINRKVASLGTKVAGAIWALTATITIS